MAGSSTAVFMRGYKGENQVNERILLNVWINLHADPFFWAFITPHFLHGVFVMALT